MYKAVFEEDFIQRTALAIQHPNLAILPLLPLRAEDESSVSLQ